MLLQCQLLLFVLSTSVQRVDLCSVSVARVELHPGEHCDPDPQ